MFGAGVQVYMPPEPLMVINDRRRLIGRPLDPYYGPTTQDFGPYTRSRLVPDVTMRAPIFTLGDIARIKDALALEGVYNVICDIPEQTVIVSTRLSPTSIVSLVRQVMGDATLISVVDPYPVSSAAVMPRTRYAYDDMYSYPSSSGYGYGYDPYNGRSYDNEFRPSRYYTGYSYY
ncbi:hypothetical protein M758_5G114700 [Ceratodon purpureus]|uniref:Uncharacterized protein n=1 Tax=Ceratodon purpureus TaxID=3225 RepID=A0A8T0I1S7_CERPU|nr:hypothetical protein KC19_5G114100 [Ceratodon purpureus]KAG0616427.1 hypothetical protein M758_5G114700 [Ceratodon purpureus]